MSAVPSSFVLALGWSLFDFVWQGALPLLGLWRGLHVEAALDASPAARFVHFPRTAGAGDATVAPAASWQSTLQQRLPWVVALWSIGASLLAARMALGLLWVARASNARGMPDASWQRTLDRLAGTIGVACAVRLRVVAEITTPVTAGWWKPVVLVPAALIAGMPPDLLEALLAHELAHVRRHDYLVNLAQSAAEALLFYHPVVWWLSSRIRVEREQVADDLATEGLGDPRRLAIALHELDLFQDRLRRSEARGPVASSNVVAADGGHLMARIQRLVRPSHHALSWKMALPIFALTASCLAARPQQATPATAAGAPPAPSAAPVVASQPTPDTPAVVDSTPAPGASPVTTARVQAVNERHGDAYALIRADRDSITMSGDTRDIPSIQRARGRLQGDFLWLRRAGKAYVVQDPAILARAMDVWKTTEPVEKQMQALEDQMRGPEQRMEALDRQMEALGDDDEDDSPARRDMGDGRMAPLQAQMQKLAAVVKQQSERIEAARAPIEKLGKQMEDENEGMEALNKQMEALSKQEEQLTREAERKMRLLIDEAMRSGKATPID